MSDNISLELQSEIMKRLPAKSLIQFRSVCKAWKSLIDTSDYIAHSNSQQQHLLVRYEDAVTFEHKYVSVVDDDDTFPHQIVSVTVPQSAVNLLTTIGTSHGLLCLFCYHLQKAVIWNPSTCKAIDVIVPDMAGDEMYTVLGFGVCRETTDPKIVKINYIVESVDGIPWQVEVFTLSTGAWRSPSNNNLPRNSVSFTISISNSPVVVDGVLYWLASDGDGDLPDNLAHTKCCNLIVSFDLTSEEFGEVNLPDSLAYTNCSLSVNKLRESLVVIELDIEDQYYLVHHVWMMEDGVPKSFKKLYTISTDSADFSIVSVNGFRKTGEPLVELQTHPGYTRILATYEPYSKSISNVGINGGHFKVFSYMETLLLL